MLLTVDVMYAATRVPTAEKMMQSCAKELSESQRAVMGHLADLAYKYMKLNTDKMEAKDWKKELSSKRVSYTGEIVKTSSINDQPDLGNLFDELMPKKRAIREASSSSEDEEEEIIVLKKRRQ